MHMYMRAMPAVIYSAFLLKLNGETETILEKIATAVGLELCANPDTPKKMVWTCVVYACCPINYKKIQRIPYFYRISTFISYQYQINFVPIIYTFHYCN